MAGNRTCLTTLSWILLYRILTQYVKHVMEHLGMSVKVLFVKCTELWLFLSLIHLFFFAFISITFFCTSLSILVYLPHVLFYVYLYL